MLTDIIFHTAIAGYFIATCIFVVYLISHNDRVVKAAVGVLTASFVLHTIVIIVRWAGSGRTPVVNLHESLLFFSWLTVALYMVMLVKFKQRVLGAFVTPFALALIMTSSFFPKTIIPLAPVLESYWLPVHVVLAFLGNAFFAIAFFLGIMYMIQEHYLKKRKLKGLFYILPSLNVIDELNYRCLQYGFPLLTLAIITGAIWSEYALGSYWQWKPRQVWSLITWFLYAALLHGRLTAGWRGKKAALLSALAFMVLIGSFIMINVILGGAHGISLR